VTRPFTSGAAAPPSRTWPVTTDGGVRGVEGDVQRRAADKLEHEIGEELVNADGDEPELPTEAPRFDEFAERFLSTASATRPPQPERSPETRPARVLRPRRLDAHEGQTKWPLWKAARNAGLRRIGWHMLRHTFASHLVMRGAPIKTVQELMGHSTIEMTIRYSHLSPDARRDAVRLLDIKEPVALVWQASTGTALRIPLDQPLREAA
jgi:hypothetical protein